MLHVTRTQVAQMSRYEEPFQLMLKAFYNSGTIPNVNQWYSYSTRLALHTVLLVHTDNMADLHGFLGTLGGRKTLE